ncbi:uncharacterized protein LOC119681020 [Teleopsis dalmanni]|uniref:uncharacterized protein LOC119681020 n=1 Tax=Teleopsis dalmanni TaxID=139649 RepID=UPI0018CCE248|nr:uncharacterized protein LOC119681020 [Teleopsis dalmanni]
MFAKVLKPFYLLNEVRQQLICSSRFQPYSCIKKKPNTCPKVKPPCFRTLRPKKKKIVVKLFTQIEEEAERIRMQAIASRKPSKSAWGHTPDCCVEKCTIPFRSDQIHYRPINPHKRNYNKTWIDCRKVEKQPVCLKEEGEVSFREPQSRKFPRKGGVCKDWFPKIPSHLLPCKNKNPVACSTSVRMPNCTRKHRKPPKCKKTRVPLVCEKIVSPWPSFSECELIEYPKPEPPKECKCLLHVSLCEILRLMKEQESKKPKPENKRCAT